jgi:NADH-quinone oxidoreductase subunit I
VYNLDKLLKPASYYAGIRPENYNREEEARKAKEAAKAAKAEASAAAA